MTAPREAFGDWLAARVQPPDTSIEALLSGDERVWLEANVLAAFDPDLAGRVAEVRDAIRRLDEVTP